MDLLLSATLQHSNTPSRYFCSFLFVPFANSAVHYSTVRSVILNEVKDLSSENRGTGRCIFCEIPRLRSG